MVSPELLEKIKNALKEMDGYGQQYEMGDEDEDYYSFFGSTIVNWQSLLLTMLYLKLEKDGIVPEFSKDLPLTETEYRYVPFMQGDTDCSDIPKCTLIKKCLEDAGFVFPSAYNYIPDDVSSSYNSLYAPEAGECYSVHTDDPMEIDLSAILPLVESFLGVWGDEPSQDEVEAIRYVKKAYFEECGREIDALPEYEMLSDEEYEGSELLYEEAVQQVFNICRLPFAIYCTYNPKWQKVRAEYIRQTKAANAEGAEPIYSFDIEKYQDIEKQVKNVELLSAPFSGTSLYYDTPAFNVDILGAPATVQIVPDVNTEADEGYGHNEFFVNPLFYVTPDLPLTYNTLKEDIDAFYQLVFPCDRK